MKPVQQTKQRNEVIDATGLTIGRVATRAAVVLRGKDRASFERHLLPLVNLRIVNASKMKIAPAKFRGKTYARYSGYPGGLQFENLESKIARLGYESVLKLAIKRMIPSNKLRPRLLTNLKIEN
ncbi:MAG: uL13 family ribosomal protein [Patescibacteria group bacterium]